MKDKKLGSNANELVADSLDDAGHEVVRISDAELASKFMHNNYDAINNPQAVFTNINDYDEEEIQATGLGSIDENLRLKTLQQLQKNRFKVNRLLEEDHQKKRWMRVWKQLNGFFSRDKQSYHQHFNYHFESEDWKLYERAKIKRHRERETKNNDFYTFTDLRLRNQKKLVQTWSAELSVTAIYFVLALIFLIISSIYNNAYNTTASTTLLQTLSQLKQGVLAFSILTIIILIIPYFFLFTSWFVGINEVHKSRNFHYFMLIFLIITTMFVLVNMGLFIGYFSLSWALWIPS